jgi:hypothetical protein
LFPTFLAELKLRKELFFKPTRLLKPVFPLPARFPGFKFELLINELINELLSALLKLDFEDLDRLSLSP